MRPCRARKGTHLSKLPVISIIDDDRSVRNATDRLVRSLGFIAYSFASADEFLKSPHVNHTSCLIVDVRMPNMTGLQLQSVLLGKGLKTPIIFITAFPEEADRAMALGSRGRRFSHQAVRRQDHDQVACRGPQGSQQRNN